MRHCGSWYDVLHDETVNCCTQQQLEECDAATSLLHATAFQSVTPQRLCCTPRQLKETPQRLWLRWYQGLCLRWYWRQMLAPNVLMGACAEPNIRGHCQKILCRMVSRPTSP